MSGYLEWDDARLDAGWQGITRLALALDAETADPRGATLTVHLSRPAAGLDSDDIEVTGGRRVRGLPYQVDAIVPTASTVTIRFARLGDRSTYQVELRSGGAHALHPFFAAASFQFAIDCENADCRESPEQAAKIERPAPAIDYTTKDFTGFQNLLGDHVRVSHEDWGDLAPSSFERVVLDLLAHHGDLLGYYQDRVAGEAFVATARQRHSLRQHGALLGYDVAEGQAATTLLSVDVTSTGWVPANLAVRSSTATGEEPVVYATRARTRVRPEHNSDHLVPAAWPSASGARLPAGTHQLLLWDHDLVLGPGDRLALVSGGRTLLVDLVDVRELELPGWVAHPAQPAPAPGTTAKVTQITWDPAQRLREAITPWHGDGLAIHGNLVEAIHGEPRRASTRAHLGSDIVPIAVGARDATLIPVVRLGATDARPQLQLRALRVPEAPLVWDGGAPALEVLIDDQPWYRQEHLHASRPYDRHYTVTTEANGGVWIQLGDDVHGAAAELTDDTRIELGYRRGDTALGNCARDVLTSVVKPAVGDPRHEDFTGLGLIAVSNVTPGRGGRGRESMGAARESIPASLRHGVAERAVTLEDYARAAERVDGVARATARARGGVFNTVVVLVDAEGQGALEASLRDRVWRHLDGLRMAGREHFVVEAVYVPLDVEIWVCPQPGRSRHAVREQVLAALRPGSDLRRGFFHPDRLSFAESVELGEVLAAVQGVPGVRSAKAIKFRRLLAPADADVEARIRLSATEVARLDADPTFPDNGRLEVKVIGLDQVDEDDFSMAVGPAGGAP